MHDRIAIDGSITTTSGANSPVIRGNNNTTTVVVNHAADMNTTPVEFSRAKRSWITAKSAQITAWIASVVGATISIFTLVIPAPIWQLDTNDAASVMLSIQEAAPRFAGLALLAVMLRFVWRFAIRRRRALPKIGRRWSPFRSLIPVDTAGSAYHRTTVLARCSFCADNGREEWGVVARRGRGAGRWIGVRCRLGHRFTFRAESLFIG